MYQVRKRATARRDLVEHFLYLFEEAGLETADRFLVNAEESFTHLSTHPHLGVQLSLRNSELAGMRKWQVKDFENFLIFYQPHEDGDVSIVRVLHATRDWWSLLGIV